MTGLSESALFRHIRSGRLKCVRLGNVTLIRREDLVAFLDTATPRDRT